MNVVNLARAAQLQVSRYSGTTLTLSIYRHELFRGIRGDRLIVEVETLQAFT